MSEQNNSFSHQDWNNIVIHGKSINLNQPKVIIPKTTQVVSQMKKLEESTDVGRLKELNLSDRQLLISSRAARKLKQDQIAQALSMPLNLYKDIESGKTIPTQQHLNKINNYLKISLKLT